MLGFKAVRTFDEALKEVSTWADLEGTSIDNGILPIIARLHMLDIPTLSSCEGHAEHDFALPHVVIGYDPDLETEDTDESWQAYYLRNMQVNHRLFKALEVFYKAPCTTPYNAQVKLNLWQGGLCELTTNGGNFYRFSDDRQTLKDRYLSEIDRFSQFLINGK